MSIRIVTDSTCDLPQNLVETHNITIAPLYIQFGEEEFIDGVEMTREAFYDRLGSSPEQATTATPGIKKMVQIYEALAEEGATQILSIHISKALSATVDVARKAAHEASIPVTVMDSGQLSMGLGFLVLEAAQMARDGQPVPDILARLEESGQSIFVTAALDTLEYLRRSGRMNRIMAGIGSLLNVKPILKMNQGNPTSELVRTHKRAVQRLLDLLRERSPLQDIALVHTNAPRAVSELWEEAQSFLSHPEEPLKVNVTPVLGTHLGPGAIGFAWKVKR